MNRSTNLTKETKGPKYHVNSDLTQERYKMLTSDQVTIAQQMNGILDKDKTIGDSENMFALTNIYSEAQREKRGTSHQDVFLGKGMVI